MTTLAIRDIVKATCGGQPQRVKDYLYEELVRLFEPSPKKKEKRK